jgi:hypothetical protein
VADQVSAEMTPETPHPQFAIWMRDFRLGQDDTPTLAQRWEGVSAIVAFAAIMQRLAEAPGAALCQRISFG